MSNDNTVSLRDEIRLQEIDERHDLSQQVFFRRKENEISQEELADRAEVTQPQIARIEAGHANPTLRTLTKVSYGLGCRLRDLFQPDPADLSAPWDLAREHWTTGRILSAKISPAAEKLSVDVGEKEENANRAETLRRVTEAAERLSVPSGAVEAQLEVIEGSLEEDDGGSLSGREEARANEMLALGA